MNTSINGFFPRVSLAFARKIDTALIAFARNVIAMITGNSQYPTPQPTLLVLTSSVNTFETAVHEALDGGKIAIATRNAERATVLSLFRQLAAYVQINCDSDLVLLLSSGFNAVRAPSPIGVLPPPNNTRLLLTGISGELSLRFDRVANASNYSYQTATTGEGPWEDKGINPNTRILLTGLTPGKVCWARVRSNGTAGPSEWSNPTTAMAV